MRHRFLPIACLLAAASADVAAVSSGGVSLVGDALLPCIHAATADPAATACLPSASAGGALPDGALRSALESCMLRGFWGCSRAVLSLARAAKADISGTLHATRTRITSALTTLADSLNSEQQVHDNIAPAYEWAQSVEHIFLQVKWAHKLDAPATLGCRPDEPAFEPAALTFRATCAEKRKAFSLTLALFGNVTVEGCSWANASVGRASVTLRKSEDGPWARLLAGKARPSNQNIWWCVGHPCRPLHALDKLPPPLYPRPPPAAFNTLAPPFTPLPHAPPSGSPLFFQPAAGT
jgi:hypothetical protein